METPSQQQQQQQQQDKQQQHEQQEQQQHEQQEQQQHEQQQQKHHEQQDKQHEQHGQQDKQQQQQQNEQQQQPETKSQEDKAVAMVEIEGLVIPRFFENNRPMEEHVELLKALEMRDDDVILMAYCKSGTHWLWEMLSMLVAGKAEYEKRTKIFTMMETIRPEDLAVEPSPRVLNSHFPFRLLPRQILDKKVKIIHIYRNVKDVFVSFYFHFRQNPGGESMTWELLEKMFMHEKMPTGNYFVYMKEMCDFRRNNPDHPFFLVSYEETKENPEKVIKQLAQFIGVTVSPELLKEIAVMTNFAKMRHAEKNSQKTHLPPAEIFRKGEVGDWKNHLTVALSERLEAAVTQLDSCDYNFRYTL